MAAGRGRPRLPDDPYIPPTDEERAAGTTLACRVCGLERRSDDFSDGQRRSSWPQCRTCARQRVRDQASRRGTDHGRANNIKRMYGLTLDDVREMRAQQGDRCPICQEALGPSHAEAAVDHRPRTGFVRRLLHPLCNTGLGHFCDDPERLRRAASYLEEAQRRVDDPDARFIPARRLGRQRRT